MEHINWNGFNKGIWTDEINVRDFIQTNYTEYTGDESFLEGATDRTKELMTKLEDMLFKGFLVSIQKKQREIIIM